MLNSLCIQMLACHCPISRLYWRDGETAFAVNSLIGVPGIRSHAGCASAGSLRHLKAGPEPGIKLTSVPNPGVLVRHFRERALLSGLCQGTMLQARFSQGVDGPAVFELALRRISAQHNFPFAACSPQACMRARVPPPPPRPRDVERHPGFATWDECAGKDLAPANIAARRQHRLYRGPLLFLF